MESQLLTVCWETLLASEQGREYRCVQPSHPKCNAHVFLFPFSKSHGLPFCTHGHAATTRLGTGYDRFLPSLFCGFVIPASLVSHRIFSTSIMSSIIACIHSSSTWKSAPTKSFGFHSVHWHGTSVLGQSSLTHSTFTAPSAQKPETTVLRGRCTDRYIFPLLLEPFFIVIRSMLHHKGGSLSTYNSEHRERSDLSLSLSLAVGSLILDGMRGSEREQVRSPDTSQGSSVIHFVPNGGIFTARRISLTTVGGYSVRNP